MADKRKLQAQVDMTIRKVDEGIAEFAAMWRKVEDAPSAAQRDKFQSELKREIKKLQRFRDEVMKWMSSSDIKDKAPLAETRRRIEIEMERFKAFEREAKTKPFSVMGLQMEQRVDPLEQRRQEKRETLEDLVASLKQQVDEYQADWEISNGKKKKSAADQKALDDLKVKTSRHSFHLINLELLIRKLDNDDTLLDLDDVEAVIETVSTYLSEQDSAEYFHDEQLYTHLRLNELAAAVDASYYTPALEEKKIAQLVDPLEEERLKKEREKRAKEIPLSAAAKAKAFKKDGAAAVSAGAGLHAPAPTVAPPHPVRPPIPEFEPPPLPSLENPPNRPPPPPPAPKPPVILSRTQSPPSIVLPGIFPPSMPSPPTVVIPSTSSLQSSFNSRPIVEDAILRARPNRPTVPLLTQSISSKWQAVLPKHSGTETSALFKSLSTETLLFAFYYTDGGYGSVLSARELLSRGWKFHRKLKQWIKRHEEPPRMLAPDYEYGSVVTLDPFETPWAVKIREAFTTEYALLETKAV